jgi:predicted  nucleic acid-binding Zn-ribbon protein
MLHSRAPAATIREVAAPSRREIFTVGLPTVTAERERHVTVIANLAALQQVDSELDRLQGQAADLRSRIADDSDLRQRLTVRAAVAASLQQHQLRQRQLEGESAAEAAEVQRREQRLYGGQIRDIHSMQTTQHEIEHHAGRQRELEDSLLAAMEDVEVTARKLQELDRDLAEAKAQRHRQVATWQAELQRVEADVVAAQAQRSQRAAPIPPGALDLYARLRQQKAGRAVATVQGNVCGVCRVTIPPTTLSRARPGVAFVQCDNCGRLIYVPR